MQATNVSILGAKRSNFALRMRCTMWVHGLIRSVSIGYGAMFPLCAMEKDQAGKLPRKCGNAPT